MLGVIMKVIEYGHKSRKLKCGNCESRLEYDKTDIHKFLIFTYIICPVCGWKTYVDDIGGPTKCIG